MLSKLTGDISSAIEETISNFPGYIVSRGAQLSTPIITDDDLNAIAESASSGWVSSAGPDVTLFENNLAKFVGIDHCVMVSSGTSALHLSLLAAGAGPGTAVITTPLTFVATTNAILYTGARPIFIDVDKDLMLDPDQVRSYLESCGISSRGKPVDPESGLEVVAILPVHLLGNVGEVKKLVETSLEYKIHLIEDAAESLGSRSNEGKHAGTFGTLSAISFNGNKIITTGGGGAILTNDTEKATLVRHLSTQAKSGSIKSLSHDLLGFNYRMPNLNASLGVSQLNRITKTLEAKNKIAFHYSKGLRNEHFNFFAHTKNSNHWLNAIQLHEPNRELIDSLIDSLVSKGIQVRPLWEPMHLLSYSEGVIPFKIKNAALARDSILCLPSSVDLVSC
jgi:perosamine synthetase